MSENFPFYRQLDAMDCGAACLRMIAKHYGRAFSAEYLREISALDRNGISLMGISNAAERVGFQSLAVKVSYERLLDDLPLPCIAFWRQQHFVVVYDLNQTAIFIADPASGKLKLSKDEFLEGWATDKEGDEPSGVLLLLEAMPAFYQQLDEKIPQMGFSYFWDYLKLYKMLIVQLLAGLFLSFLIQLIFPFLILNLVDDGILRHNLDFIHLLLLAQVILVCTSIALEFFRGWVVMEISSRVNLSLVSNFLLKLMRLPIRFFDTKLTVDLLQRIFDNQRVEQFLSSSTLTTAFSTVNFVAFGIVLVFFHLKIFLIYLLFTVIYIAFIFFFLKKRKDLEYKRFDQIAENHHSLVQLINGIQEIKLYNAETQKLWQWERIQARIYKLNLEYQRVERLQLVGTSFLTHAKSIVISYIAAKAVIDRDMTLGMLFAVQYIVAQLNQPLEQLVQFILGMQDAKIRLERMNEIHLQKVDEKELDQNKKTQLSDYQDIILKNVSFKYAPTDVDAALDDIDLHIPKGKMTAIVGANGSGKTTLIKLILGILTPTEGNIYIGTDNLQDINSGFWRSNCGTVMQDGFIFSDTVSKNIALGTNEIDKEKLMLAQQITDLQDVINVLPLGYDTKIGEDGVALNISQKQRVLIARAMYKNANFLFLEEATNALDPKTESIIFNNIQQLYSEKTVIIVAPRLNILKSVDNIIVLDKGKVVEQGTHNSLVAKNGLYCTILKNQI